MSLLEKIKDNAFILLFLVSAITVMLLSMYSNSSFRGTEEDMAKSAQERLIRASDGLARATDTTRLDPYQTMDDIDDPAYVAIKNELVAYCEEEDLLFAYYYRVIGDGSTVQGVVDNDFSEDAYTPEVFLDTESALLDVLQHGTAFATDLKDYSEGFDGLMSAFSPVRNANGEITYMVGVDIYDEQLLSVYIRINDLFVTQLVGMLIVLLCGGFALYFYRRKAHMAQSANVAKSQFLSRMSHEIRTPMNAIIGLSRMAQESDDPKRVDEYLHNIDGSANHLLSLINDVLDISKIESGKMVAQLSAVDIRKELDAIQVIIAPNAAAKRINLVFHVDENVPRYLYCDNTHIRQIVVNLLSNSVKFTPEGGRVEVNVRKGQSDATRCNILWSIKDNGIGIDKKYIGKLFDPFEQGDGGTTRKYGGSGLGLAITKQLVSMSDGKIEVKSELGKGSEFLFNTWLDIAEEAQAEPELDVSDQALDLTGKCILLVEDVEINQIIAQDAFEGLGANVTVASDGQEGYDTFIASPDSFDVIFMDIQMPVLDGYQATTLIRESGAKNAKTIPIIAMTANVFKEDVDHALNAGMDGHVGKPFEIAQIKAVLLRLHDRIFR